MSAFVTFALQLTQDMGYWGIFILMTIESSFIPFPSEIIVPPAAYLASKGVMNIYLVIIFGILGSLLGAIINYYLALTLGRKLVYSLLNTKVAKFLLLDEVKMKKAEEYFLKYGVASTFFGRLVFGVRQLISIPAGFSKMNLSSFVFFTSLGSGIWVIILAILGYVFGANENLFQKSYRYISIASIILGILIIYYFVRKKKRGTT